MKRYCFDEKPVVVSSRIRRMAYDSRGISVRGNVIFVSFDVTAETEPEAEIIAENFLDFAANKVPFTIIEMDIYKRPRNTFVVDIDFNSLDVAHKSVKFREYVKAQKESKQIGSFPTREFAALFIQDVLDAEIAKRRITKEQLDAWVFPLAIFGTAILVIWMILSRGFRG